MHLACYEKINGKLHQVLHDSFRYNLLTCRCRRRTRARRCPKVFRQAWLLRFETRRLGRGKSIDRASVSYHCRCQGQAATVGRRRAFEGTTFDSITGQSDRTSLFRNSFSNSSHALPLPRRHGEVPRNRHRRAPRLHASAPDSNAPLYPSPALRTRTIARRHRSLIDRQLTQIRTNWGR